MLIAQITDIHLGFGGDGPETLNRRRLDSALAALVAMTPRPDLLLMTGDLADAGDDAAAYRALKAATAGLPFSAYPMVGNHDGRAAFAAAFPDFCRDGFAQYEIDAGPLRILALDTVEEGRHGGAFCAARAQWLMARLAEQPERPTLIALHHPPIDPGLSWMGENPDAAWVRRLEAVLSRHGNVVGIVAGHLHRPLVTLFAGTLLAVCAATAPELALDLSPIDTEAPDDRAMIVEEPPAFALHVWTGQSLVTHFGAAGEAPILSRYTPPWQPLLRLLAEERRAD